MGLGRTNVGGSNILNLTVLGGTTQPASPKENTIWVNTGEAISEWVFSAARPATRLDGSALSGGEVWFKIGTASNVSLNILKRNGAFEHPIACMQYVSGAWAAKTAKTYKNGAWADWGALFYSGGAINSDYGGLSELGTSGIFTYGESAITLERPVSYGGSALYLRVRDAVDLTPFSTFKAIVDFTSYQSEGYGEGAGSISIHANSSFNTIGPAHMKTTVNGNGQVLSIDVSSFTGNYYTALCMSWCGKLVIHSWWGEY